MAATPPHAQTDQQVELSATSAQDPFWQSTQHYNRGSLAALMEAIQQVVPPPPTPIVQKPKIPAQPHPHHTRRGQCTHITMVRLHTSQVCQMCHKHSSMGWLYACRQGWLLDHQAAVASPGGEEGLSVGNDSDYFEVMARQATNTGLSCSVANQIRKGAYTFDEISKLIAQKEHLLDVIKSREQSATESTLSNLRPALANALAAVSASAQPMRTSSKDPSVTSRCNYMVCHTCRPFLQDRIFTTLDTIVKGEHPPITENEIKTLPMLDPATVRNIGVCRTGNAFSMGNTGGGVAEGGISDTSSTRSSVSSLYDYDDEDDPSSLYPCPGAGVCPVYSRNSGCAYDSGFDDGQRAYNHGFYPYERGPTGNEVDYATPDRSRYRPHHMEDGAAETPGGTASTASSISLPTPATAPLTPETPTDQPGQHALMVEGKTGKAATVCGVMNPSMNLELARSGRNTRRASEVSFDDELDVDGVALTEEAVGAGVPDIVEHD